MFLQTSVGDIFVWAKLLVELNSRMTVQKLQNLQELKAVFKQILLTYRPGAFSFNHKSIYCSRYSFCLLALKEILRDNFYQILSVSCRIVKFSFQGFGLFALVLKIQIHAHEWQKKKHSKAFQCRIYEKNGI